MTQESLTHNVPVAAAILRVTSPAPKPDRTCKVCREQLPAGMVRHLACRPNHELHEGRPEQHG